MVLRYAKLYKIGHKKCEVHSCNNYLMITNSKIYCHNHNKKFETHLSKGVEFNPNSTRFGIYNGRYNNNVSEYKNHYLFKINRKIKLQQKNNKCEVCNNNAKIVHHLDGLKTNHAMENLQVLCNICHCKEHKKLRDYKKELETDKKSC